MKLRLDEEHARINSAISENSASIKGNSSQNRKLSSSFNGLSTSVGENSTSIKGNTSSINRNSSSLSKLSTSVRENTKSVNGIAGSYASKDSGKAVIITLGENVGKLVVFSWRSFYDTL